MGHGASLICDPNKGAREGRIESSENVIGSAKERMKGIETEIGTGSGIANVAERMMEAV